MEKDGNARACYVETMINQQFCWTGMKAATKRVCTRWKGSRDTMNRVRLRVFLLEESHDDSKRPAIYQRIGANAKFADGRICTHQKTLIYVYSIRVKIIWIN